MQIASTIDDLSPRRRAERLLRIFEGLAVFVLGVVVMNYFYAASTPRPGREIGVPEHDSYYHIAMSSMLPEHGLMGKFPWLQFVYFRQQGDDFVSHHTGFHLLMLPFVKMAEWLTGDALPGGRWAMSAVFGANLLVFHLLLRQRRVPWHWLWIAAFLLLPDQFFARHGYVRAIGASFLVMQLLLLALFAGRYIIAGLTLALYVHLYLGAVIYAPIAVALYAFGQVVGPREDRRWPWKMVGCTIAGWLLGLATYPYAGVIEFLRMQVFGSGLSPDIQVGREWFPYSDAWYIMATAGPLLGAWALAITLRLRLGPRLDARDTAVLLLQFVFLVLTFKARRFIEYWPPLCLLSTAYIAAPPLASATAAVRGWWMRRSAGTALGLSLGGVALLLVAIGGALFFLTKVDGGRAVLIEWRTWLAVMLLLALPLLARVAAKGHGGERPALLNLVGVIAAGGLIVAVMLCVAMAKFHGTPMPPPRTFIPGWAWGTIAGLYGLVPLLAMKVGGNGVGVLRPSKMFGRMAVIALLALLLPTATLAIGAKTFESASRQLRCYYNLDDIRELMAFMKQNSDAGDVVFTDDWDIFPPFFYFNRHNHYIVGLDPKFTQTRRPDLWSRYVKISRGEVPTTIRLASGGQDTCGLSDIRTHFHCRFVIADRDHRRLADALAKAPELAEFVFPGKDYGRARGAPYVVFRMRDPGEKFEPEDVAQEPVAGVLPLSRLRPVSATQGWGELGADRSVDGNVLTVAGRSFDRGLGTHAPAKLVYEIPEGYDWLEALVGIDDETETQGTAVVSIHLDGRKVFESPVLRGGNEPVIVKIPLGGARQVLLEADTTADGQRFDHVDWCDVRFTKDKAAPPASQSGSAPTASGP